MRRGDAAVAGALRRDAARAGEGTPLPAAAVERGVAVCLKAMGPGGPAPAGEFGLWWAVFGAQWRLFSSSIRWAAALVLLLGVALALLAPGSAATMLDFAAPAAAAGGVLAAFGGARRASLEVELACAVRPYELLLARLILVVGCDLALALAASVVLSAAGHGGAALHLVLTWLGPLLLLAGLNLAVSLRWGAAAAGVAGGALWMVSVTAATRVATSPGLAWCVPPRMPTPELLALAATGVLLLVWTVARGAPWLAPRGDQA